MVTNDRSQAERRSATIYDVAQAAGVSTATVSNVLRGTRQVRPDLQKRVLDAVTALSYTPQRATSGLHERHSRTIGVVVPDITTGLFYNIVRRIEQRAACTDYQIILADTQEDFSSERERVHALVKRKIDGLIFVPCRDDSPVLEELRERRIATVLLDRVGRDIDFDSVSADNVAATSEGTRHLIALGHRRIALVASDPNLRNIRGRIQGYKEALHEAGLSQFENVLITGQNAPEAVEAVLKPLLLKASRPSAIFPVTQHMTFGTLKTIGRMGLDLPNDLSLLAFDDCEWFTALRPFLSSIRQPAEDFADQAWSILMARLNNDRSSTLHSEVHCSLVIRESTIPYQGQAVNEAVPMMVT